MKDTYPSGRRHERNRMRATIRITWLLLSLSFLLHNVSSDDADPSVSTTRAPTTMSVSVVASASAGLSGSATTKKADSLTLAPTTTLPPTTSKPASATSTPAVVTSTQPKPADKPTTTQTQITAATTKPALVSTTLPGGAPAVVKDSTVSAATPSPSKPVASTATAGSSGASTVAPTASTAPKTNPPVTTKISMTKATPGPAGSIGKDVTTQNPTVTPGSSIQTQPVTHTTNPSTTSQGDSKRGTETTGTVKSHEQTTSKAQEPTVSTGATSSNAVTPTNAGLPSVVTQKDAATSSQTTIVRTITTAATASQLNTFSFSLNNGKETEEEKELVHVCKQLMMNLEDGDCTLKWQRHNDKTHLEGVEIRGKVKTNVAMQYYEEISKKPTDNKTLIAILASCGALLIMIVILAVCASHRRKPYNENQQHLTEELHTVENGYHDNPTLEVMEVQPEMQEKKMPLNGEFNDSWIVPMDNLPKGCEDIPEEEDTHL